MIITSLLFTSLSAESDFFSTLYDQMGGGGGILKNNGQNKTVFSLKFKTISPLTKDYSAFLLSERSSYLNDLDDMIYSTGMIGLGLIYHPWENKKYFSFSVAGGWAQNMNDTTLFSDFWNSFTFGTGIYAGVSYQIVPKWDVEISYANYKFTDEIFDAETLLLTLTYSISFEDIFNLFE